MPNSPLVVTWPGGIGNPIGEKIPTSGGRRRKNRSTRRRRGTRKSRRCWTRRNTRR